MQLNTRRPSWVPLTAVAGGLMLLATACTPSGPKALLQGEELIRKGNYEDAVKKLELATNLLPNEARAWNYLGVAHHRAGQYADARLAYERALQLDRNLAVARFNLGKMYLDQGVPMSALEQLSTFVMLEPKSVEGRVLIGDANLELFRYDQALQDYSSALRLDRDLPEAYNGIGLVYMQKNNAEEAYRFFVEALKYDASYAPAILNLAIVLQTKFDAKPIALSRYREYLSKAPPGTDLTEVRAVVDRLNNELNPPIDRVDEPVQIASVDTNLTRVTAADEAQTSGNETETNTVAAVPPKTETKENKPREQSEPKPTGAGGTRPESSVSTTPAPTAVAASTDKPKTGGADKPEPSTREPEEKLAASTDQPVRSVENEAVKPAVSATRPDPKPAVVAANTNRAPETGTSVVKEPPADPTRKTEVARPSTPVPDATPATQITDVTNDEPDESDEPLEVVQLEVVDLEPELEIPVPQETPSQPPAVRETAPVEDTPMETASAPRTGIEEPVPVADEPSKKRGFFQRINPANLFRDNEEEGGRVRSEPTVTPLPPSRNASPPAEEQPSTLPTEPRQVARSGDFSEVTPMTTRRGPRRYPYSQSGPPVPGDRAASERLFQRGLDAQAQLDPGRAASYFASAAMADPSYFPAQYNLGLLSYQTGQTMKSLSAFETALALDPSSAEARYNFALALQKANYPLDAVEELDRLLESYPDNLRAHLLLGNVYAQDLQDIERARSQYQTVLQLDSDHPQAPAIRAWMRENP